MPAISRLAWLWLALLLSAGVCAGTSQDSGAAELRVENVWIREPPPGTDVAAAYFTLHNAGSRALVLTAITTPVASAAMLHETTTLAGVERMRPLEQLTIAAGQTIVLKPGGLHVMLGGLRQRLQVGESVSLMIHLQSGAKIPVTARVRPLGGE